MLELDELPLLALFRAESMEMSVLRRSGLLQRTKVRYIHEGNDQISERPAVVLLSGAVPGPYEVSSGPRSKSRTVSRRVLPDQSRRNGGCPLRNLEKQYLKVII